MTVARDAIPRAVAADESGTAPERVVRGLSVASWTPVAPVCDPIDAIRSPGRCGIDLIEGRRLASERSVTNVVLVAREIGVVSAFGFVEDRSVADSPGNGTLVADIDTDCCDGWFDWPRTVP